MEKTNKSIQITETELADVTRIRDMQMEAQFAFGQFYLAKKQMDINEKSLNDAYIKLQEDEQKLLNDIVNKYGEGNLDPKTGIFTPKQ